MMLRKTCGCSRNLEPPEDVPVSGKNAPERSLGPCPSVNLNHWIHTFKGDDVAVGNMLEIFDLQSQTLTPEVIKAFKFHFKAGHGGYPLVGTPEQIVERIQHLSSLGVDGMLISWVDYLGDCQQWIDDVLPLMEQTGLRKSFKAPPP